MIFAAGLGTRLKPFTDNHPKALAMVNGKTLLEHNILYLQKFGINEVVVNVHHFAEQIERVLQDSNGFGSIVHISDERNEVLETGGGLLKAASFFKDEDLVIVNVDILSNLNLSNLLAYHQQHKALATLAVIKRNSSRQLLFDESMQLCGWKNRQSEELKMPRVVDNPNEFAFSGIQVVNSEIFEHIKQRGKFSIIDAYLSLANNFIIKGFDHSGDLLLDVGKPESLHQAELLFPKN